MTPLSFATLEKLAPQMSDPCRAAFAQADAVLTKYAINASARRLTHFLAQVLHETRGLTALEENLSYSAERIVAVWPNRFRTVADARPYEHNPKKLANNVYGSRMGNTGPEDGWRYHGRGLLQITGKEAYAKYGARLGIDLVTNPELALSAAWLLPIACEEWIAVGCNKAADADNLREITRRINGGFNGLDDRRDWLLKTRAAVAA